MNSSDIRSAILDHVRSGGHLTLILDYDGTLVPIAPTPAEATPDAELLDLLRRLTLNESIRTAILSGRPLRDLEQMLPVANLVLCGLYGVEIRIAGRTIGRAPESGAEILRQLRLSWTRLVGGLPGFLLEDKGQALALHARWADAGQARRVLAAARQVAEQIIDPGAFRMLDGERYFEVAPIAADKGATVEWLLNEY